MADEVIAVSQTVRDDLLLCGAAKDSKITLIYNPIIPDDFEALALTPPEHPWLKDKTVPVLVAAGRLLPVKDSPTVLRAFEKAREARPLRLIVYGEGSERPRLEKLLHERGLEQDVSLPGAIANVFSALSHADLFVLSSRSEAFGNVVAEALACGAKIVATACGGPQEILENGRWGKLVPCENPGALAEGILKTLDEPNDPKARKERGFFFSATNAAEAYLALITKP
jgi:glycosyltransferase involved in cell wall biosynthesis